MSEKNFFEWFDINTSPSWEDVHNLINALLEDPDNETGWEFFQEIFDYIVNKGADYAQRVLPDPLSFGFFQEEYGEHFDMTDVML